MDYYLKLARQEKKRVKQLAALTDCTQLGNVQGAPVKERANVLFSDIRNKHYGSPEGRDLLSLAELDTQEVQELLHLAAQLKAGQLNLRCKRVSFFP